MSKPSDKKMSDVLGLDYLLASDLFSGSTPTMNVAAANPSLTTSAPSLIAKAKEVKRMMQMKEVLDKLTQQPGSTGKLLQLLNDPNPLDMDMPALWSLVSEMEKEALITVIKRDRSGDWEIAITSHGRDFLQELNS